MSWTARRHQFTVTYRCLHTAQRSLPDGPGLLPVKARKLAEAADSLCPICQRREARGELRPSWADRY